MNRKVKKETLQKTAEELGLTVQNNGRYAYLYRGDILIKKTRSFFEAYSYLHGIKKTLRNGGTPRYIHKLKESNEKRKDDKKMKDILFITRNVCKQIKTTTECITMVSFDALKDEIKGGQIDSIIAPNDMNKQEKSLFLEITSVLMVKDPRNIKVSYY
ncbi:hypothetical protein ACWA2C_16820 [Priestia megaterium]